MPEPERLGSLALAALAALGIALLGFRAGGFFPGAQAAAAVVLLGLLAVRVLTARDPLAGLSGPLAITLAALGAFAAWTLLSSAWSGSQARALVEFDRVVVYAAALALFGSFARSARRTSAILDGVLAGMTLVCVAGLAARLFPDVVSIGISQRLRRLDYPVTYANTLGLLAALAAIWALAVSSDLRRAPWVRVLAAAVVPVVATTLLLTYSRGAIAAGLVGLVVFAAVGRPRGLVAAALAIAPCTAVAVAAAYRASVLSSTDFTSQRALHDGHRVALVLAAAAVGAAALRAVAVGLDRRLSAARLRPEQRRRVAAGACAAGAIVLVALAVAVDLPHVLRQQYEGFKRPELVVTADVRDRLTASGSNGRSDAWKVALEDFRAEPILGAGAGTFELSWNRRRPNAVPFNLTHSLALQMLGELGLVGLVLLLVALATIFAGFRTRAHTRARPLYAALLAGAIAWSLNAAIDWQWQMPVATVWLFMLGGAALAARSDEGLLLPLSAWPARVLIAVGLLALAIVPARMALSERRLTEGVSAFVRHDYPRAATAARAAREMLPARPEPYDLLAYCAVLRGNAEQGLRMARAAVARDPGDWQFRYTLALVQAATGHDPHRAAAAARRLNPHEPLARAAAVRFSGGDPAAWRRAAARTPISIDYNR